MARSSDKDTARHREEIVAAASRLFRERGIDGVSVPEIMGAAGMTHGGFYRPFDSKEHLAALAAARAVQDQGRRVAGVPDEAGLVGNYLSASTARTARAAARSRRWRARSAARRPTAPCGPSSRPA